MDYIMDYRIRALWCALSATCRKSNLDDSYELFFNCSLQRDILLIEPNISLLVGVNLDFSNVSSHSFT
jgi:hypothetical protein